MDRYLSPDILDGENGLRAKAKAALMPYHFTIQALLERHDHLSEIENITLDVSEIRERVQTCNGSGEAEKDRKDLLILVELMAETIQELSEAANNQGIDEYYKSRH